MFKHLTQLFRLEELVSVSSQRLLLMISFLSITFLACDHTYNGKLNKLDWKNTINQKQLNECGVAVSKMILNYYNRANSYDEIKDSLPLRAGGLSMYDLKIFFEANDLQVKPVRCTPYSIVEQENPMVFLMDWDHFIVVDSVDYNQKVYLRDPLQGRCTIDVKTFFNYTQGLALIVHKSII